MKMASQYKTFVKLLSLSIAAMGATCTPAAWATCTPAPAGLVSWWPGEGNASDIVGTNNGTLEYAGFSAGEAGQAFYLNGTNADVKIPASSSLNVGADNGFTLEAWVSCANPAALSPIFEWNQADGTTSWGVHFYVGAGGPGSLYANIVDAGGWHVISSATGIIPTNVFCHAALTYDKASGLATIYCNGTNVAQSNLGSFTPLTAYNLYLGARRGPDAYYYFSGLIDEPSVYSRALAASEVAAIYDAGSAGKCSPGSTTTTGVPAIQNVSPLSGPTGTVVTIAGANFNPTASSNIVFFGAVQASVLAATATNLTVTVPVSATYAPVTVTVGGLTARANLFFLPTFTGNGSGIVATNFGPSFNLSTPSGPVQTVIADLDGDGQPDLIVLEGNNGNTISIFRNISTNGILSASSFAPRIDLPTTGSNPGRLAVADVDGDGKLDIIVTDDAANLVSVYHNHGTPGNINTNSFDAPVNFAVGAGSFSVAVADLDGDGKPEIVTGNDSDGTVSILHNTSIVGSITTNSFAPRVDFPLGPGCQSVAICDLNGDGQPDVVGVDNDGTLAILQNLGSPGSITNNSFGPPIYLSMPAGGVSVTIVDLDGDGNPDLAVTSYLPQTLSIFRNLGAGGNLTTNSFAPRVDFGLDGRGHTIAVGDLDGDGKPDLAVDTELNSLVSLFDNLSTPGSFTSSSLAPQVELSTGWNAWGISVGDLDGDGRPDFVFANSYDGNLQIYQNLTPFGTSIAPAIAIQPTNLTVTVNGTAVFNVIATGTQPVTYQWFFNGAFIPGAGGATLNLTNVQPAQAGIYSVLVSNLVGAVVSSNALLTVNVPSTPPTILAQSPSQMVALGHPGHL